MMIDKPKESAMSNCIRDHRGRLSCAAEESAMSERLSPWMGEARMSAAQCWCDEATSGREMDPQLAEAVARRIAAWMDTAAVFARNEDFYRSLLDRCALALGPAAYTSDDGSVHPDPIRLRVPELVEELVYLKRQIEASRVTPPSAERE